MTTPDWNAVVRQLSDLADTWDPKLPALEQEAKARNWEPWKWEYFRLLWVDAGDLERATRVYFDGITAIRSNAVHAGSDGLARWCAMNDERLWFVIERMVVLTLVSTVETYVTRIAKLWLESDATLRKVRELWPGGQTKPSRENIVPWLRPTAEKAGEKWLNTVESAFLVQLPTPVRDTLSNLLAVRPELAHGALVLANAGPNAPLRIESYLRAVRILGFVLVDSIQRNSAE